MLKRWKKFDLMLPLDCNIYKGNTCNRLDAIFISTRNKPQRVCGLLDHLGRQDIVNNVFIVGSDTDDVPKNKAFFDLTSEFKNHSNELAWDLPEKRNFSIDYSLREGFNRIMLLDDDIRFIDLDQLQNRLTSALDNYWVAGMYSVGEFDTSVVGGIARKYGADRNHFLSGNCLAINLEKFKPFFPSIYNEDWLAILPAILNRKAVMLGPAVQLKRRVNNPIEVAKFQEIGEIIADELYSHANIFNIDQGARRFYEHIYNNVCWATVVSQRIDWINSFSILLKSEDEASPYIKLFDILLDYLKEIHGCPRRLKTVTYNILKNYK